MIESAKEFAERIAEWVQGGSPMDETATEHLAISIAERDALLVAGAYLAGDMWDERISKLRAELQRVTEGKIMSVTMSVIIGFLLDVSCIVEAYKKGKLSVAEPAATEPKVKSKGI